MNFLFLFTLATVLVGAFGATGTVSVATGNTLKVRSTSYTSGTLLYSLPNNVVVTITCQMAGTSVSGSQGTTNQWGQLESNAYGGVGYASLAYMRTSGSIPTCGSDTGNTGTVVVAAGNTLTVRSSPSTSATILRRLNNGAAVPLTCVTTGTSVSGSQGTTSNWYEIDNNGYSSAAYIKFSGSLHDCSVLPPNPPTPNGTALQQAMDYARARVGTIYVGCAGGDYRYGKVAPSNLYHDGRTCGQSRVYFQPKGSVGFDCSGLMGSMFAAAGINFPYYSSTAIKAYVPQVSKSSIRAGDMLAKNGHVVFYAGNNQVYESTPYSQKSDTSWLGTRLHSASSYLSSTSYTAHRVPGIN